MLTSEQAAEQKIVNTSLSVRFATQDPLNPVKNRFGNERFVGTGKRLTSSPEFYQSNVKWIIQCMRNPAQGDLASVSVPKTQPIHLFDKPVEIVPGGCIEFESFSD